MEGDMTKMDNKQYNINLGYWLNRYEILGGRKTVGHISWDDADYLYEKTEIQKQLKRFLPSVPEFNILDFGCGICRHMELLKEVYPNGTYYGTDIVSGVIHENKIYHESEKCHFELFDGYKIPFTEPRLVMFNLIFCSVVLQHIIDNDLLDLYISQFWKRVKEKGYVLIYENIHSENKDKDYIKFRTAQTYHSLFEKVGFEFIRSETGVSMSELHIAILFRKPTKEKR